MLDGKRPNHPRVVVKLEESERQAVILALAELSIARPGWVRMIEDIARKMDNVDQYGNAQMFERFRRNHSDPVAEKLQDS